MTPDTLRESANVLTLHDGKYTLVLHENGQARVLRYGEPWRNLSQELVGDHFMASLIEYAMRSQTAHDADKARIAVLDGAVMEARRVIRLDRESLFECHRDPKTGDVIDQPGIDGLREYDDALSLLDAALATQASEVE
jgi:hypothetical protein